MSDPFIIPEGAPSEVELRHVRYRGETSGGKAFKCVIAGKTIDIPKSQTISKDFTNEIDGWIIVNSWIYYKEGLDKIYPGWVKHMDELAAKDKPANGNGASTAAPQHDADVHSIRVSRAINNLKKATERANKAEKLEATMLESIGKLSRKLAIIDAQRALTVYNLERFKKEVDALRAAKK